jgi:hypothetical protein
MSDVAYHVVSNTSTVMMKTDRIKEFAAILIQARVGESDEDLKENYAEKMQI